MCYVCVGVVDTVLSWPGWVPLSRLTYAVYLTHPLVIFIIYKSRPVPLYVDDFTVVSLPHKLEDTLYCLVFASDEWKRPWRE